jgi:hypothetical protein
VESPRHALHDTFDLGLLVGDAELCSSVYAPNAIIVTPDRGVVYGRRKIRDYWQQLIDEECRGHTLVSQQIEARETRIVERGCYAHFQHPVALNRYTAWGNYVLVVERLTDGSWAWTADTWSDVSKPAPT